MSTVLWGTKDIAEYRGVTRDAITKQMRSVPPPEPDFVTLAGLKYWLPETVKPWADALPTRGSYSRQEKVSK